MVLILIMVAVITKAQSISDQITELKYETDTTVNTPYKHPAPGFIPKPYNVFNHADADLRKRTLDLIGNVHDSAISVAVDTLIFYLDSIHSSDNSLSVFSSSGIVNIVLNVSHKNRWMDTQSFNFPLRLKQTAIIGQPFFYIGASTADSFGFFGHQHMGQGTGDIKTYLLADGLFGSISNYVNDTNVSTLTNKRWGARCDTSTNFVISHTLNTDLYDDFSVSAQSGSLLLNNPSGTPIFHQYLNYYFHDNGTPQTLSWDTNFIDGASVSKPLTTVSNKWLIANYVYMYGKYYLTSVNQF